MTGTLIKLHLALWRRSFKGDIALIFMAGLTVFFGLIAALGLGAMNYDLITNAHDFRALPLAMGIGLLAYLMLAFTFPSPENHLDPRRFATLPITEKQLLPGLTWASVHQSRGVLTFVNSLIMAAFGIAAIMNTFAGAASIGLAIGWFIACLVQGLTAILLGEALLSISSVFAGRVWRERLGMILSITFILVVFGVNFTLNGIEDFDQLLTAGAVLAWTPAAAPAGAVAYAMSGDYLLTLATAIISIVTLLASVWLWRYSVSMQLRRPLQANSGAQTHHERPLLVSWASPTPVGAVYSRMIHYWFRDIRYSYNALMFPIIGFMFLALGVIQDSGIHYLAPIFIAQGALVIGGNDYGFDGPANWVHITAGVRGRHMVRGRLLALLSGMGSLQVLVLLALGAIIGFNAFWLGIVVISLCALAQALGLAAAIAVRFPYATAEPGTNPMKDRSGYSSGAFVLSMLSLFGIFLPLIPGAFALAGSSGGFGFLQGTTWLILTAMAIQVLLSGGIFLGGYAWAVKNLEQRWPKVFAKVRHWA